MFVLKIVDAIFLSERSNVLEWEESVLSFSLNQVAHGLETDWLARSHRFRLLIFVSLLSLSPFPPFATTQSKFSSSPLFRRALSCPNTEVGMAGWDLSLLIQYRYLPISSCSPLATFPSLIFELFRFHDLQLTIIDRRTRYKTWMTTRACTCAKIFATVPWDSKSFCLKTIIEDDNKN